MTAVHFILFGSALLFPAVVLWALRWAGRNGEFKHTDRSALLPFDESEPLGEMTDVVLNRDQARSRKP